LFIGGTPKATFDAQANGGPNVFSVMSNLTFPNTLQHDG
jgi:hypothetical protein